MEKDTYILYKKDAFGTFWLNSELAIPPNKWSGGWGLIIDHLQKLHKLNQDGTYALQNATGRGFCVFSVETPALPEQVIKFL